MKKITKKKMLTAVTGATVIGVAAAALVNGSKLELIPENLKNLKIIINLKNMITYPVMEKRQIYLVTTHKKKKKTKGIICRYFSCRNRTMEN